MAVTTTPTWRTISSKVIGTEKCPKLSMTSPLRLRKMSQKRNLTRRSLRNKRKAKKRLLKRKMTASWRKNRGKTKTNRRISNSKSRSSKSNKNLRKKSKKMLILTMICAISLCRIHRKSSFLIGLSLMTPQLSRSCLVHFRARSVATLAVHTCFSTDSANLTRIWRLTSKFLSTGSQRLRKLTISTMKSERTTSSSRISLTS